MNPDCAQVTTLLNDLAKGNDRAASKLIPLVYSELRRLARNYMRRERTDHTLQATALVHEAYLKLIEQRSVEWKGRAHFFGIAAQMMRRILIDHARSHLRDKRGRGAVAVPLEEAHEQQKLQLVTLLKTKALKRHMESITYILKKLPREREFAGSRPPPASS